jgi:hypothetical protein
MAVQLILLHSPLVGPGTWRLLSPELQGLGFQTVTVDFRPDIALGSPYYANLVSVAQAALAGEPNTKDILVAHSGAGSLVPAIAERSEIAGAIFVDALLPHPNRSWFSTISDTMKTQLMQSAHDGRLPPWHRWWPDGAIRSLFDDDESYAQFVRELSDIPLDLLSEDAPSHELPRGLPCAYLQLDRGNAAEANRTETLGWPVRRFTLHHLAMLTHPKRVASAINELVRAI